MSKFLKIFGNIIFLINTLMLFSTYTHIIDFSFTRLMICSVVVIILFVINIMQIKSKNNILNDKQYILMFFLVNMIVLIIFLRDRLDTMIPLGSLNYLDPYNAESSGLFIDYNTIYITIMYTGILLYNLLNTIKLKRKKK